MGLSPGLFQQLYSEKAQAKRLAALYEAERAYQEAFAHLGLRTDEERAGFEERVRSLMLEAHMDLVPAIHWAEAEWENNPPSPLRTEVGV